MSWAEGISAAVSGGLFVLTAVRCAGAACRELRTRPEPAGERADRRTLLGIWLALLAWEGAVLLLMFVLRMALGHGRELRPYLEFWTQADGQHYMAIAEEGYLREGSMDRLVQLVFLPGYPLAVRAAALLTGDTLYGGFLVSWLAFPWAGTVLYRLTLLDTDRESALRAVRYLCLLPGSFFFAAPMSESLFLLLSLGCVYTARRERWLAAGLLGGLASFTRSPGITLAVPLGWELLRKGGGLPGRTLLRWGTVLLVPAGFGAYCLICRAVTGDALRWMVYQREHWHQSPGLFFRTAAYQTRYVLERLGEEDYPLALGLWLPNLLCSFGALGAAAAAGKGLRPGYTAYFLAYFALAVGATWLLSAPRYMTALFPVALALGELSRDRRRDGALTAALGGAWTLYALLFAARWQVW